MKHTPEKIKYRLSDLGVQIGNIAIEYITELEKENAELKNRNKELLQSCEGATMMYKDLQKTNIQLTKAKEIIKDQKELLDSVLFGAETLSDFARNTLRKAEQFLSEVEK